MGTDAHKAGAPAALKVAVISVSTTRTLAEDKSGHWIAKRAYKEGHQVVRHIVVPDEAWAISGAITEILQNLHPDAILLTGGTGISPADVTIEAVRPLFQKELTAFGSIFAQLSYEEIDSAALLSRATAGVIQQSIVFCMPGSLPACKLACKALIFPELGHLVHHARGR